MTCAFCDQEKLLRQSHVIPLGIWRLKDNDSGFLEVSTESNLKPRRINKGWHQQLLCDDCEKYFGREFDDFGRNFFASVSAATPITLGPNAAYFEFADVDANKLKLFVLSVLWRASVATKEPFAEFKLLPQQEQKLKEMLLHKDAGGTFDFATAIFQYTDDGRNLHRIAVAPRLFRESGCVRYAEIQFNEFACRVNVSNQQDKARFDQVWLTESQPVRIIQTSPAKKIDLSVRMLSDQYKRFDAFRRSHSK